MTGTVVEEGVKDEQTAEQAEQAKQAADAFASGFDGDEEQTTTPAPSAKEPEPKPEAKPEVKPDETPAPKLAQITEEQFADLMAKASRFDESRRQIDTLSGHIGGMKQVVEGLKAERKTLTPGQLKRVATEFPELAEALQADLGEMAGAAVDPKVIEQIVETRVAATRQEAIDSTLDAIFDGEDWHEQVKSSDYQAWIAKQPVEVKKLAESDSLRDAARHLRLFKAGRQAEQQARQAAEKAAADAAAAAAKKQSGDTRRQRLEAAVPPRGNAGVHSGANNTARDDFSAGWDSA